MTPKLIILVGGGTGGHIMPLVAIGEELSLRRRPFIFVGDAKGREVAIVAGYGWQFIGLHSGKFRRDWSLLVTWQNLIDLGVFTWGFFESVSLLIRTGASVVFSKGGYVALPMVLAAKFLGRQVIIHESDAVMGLTNRLSVRLATKVLTAFNTAVFPNRTDRFEQVGIPIRTSLRQAAKLKAPRKSRPLIFVLAGIQGSHMINQLVRAALPALLPIADVVHVTGESEAEMHKNLAATLVKKFGHSYKTFPFIDRELSYYYQASDLIITRSSATVVAEAALFNKPVYLIPLPTSAGNHQLKNAQYLQAAGAAVMAEESTLTAEKLAEDVKRILADKTQMENLGARLSRYFNEDKAINRITELITGTGENDG